MKLNELIPAIEAIDKAQDFFAMDAAAELLLVHYIPETSKVSVQKLIEDVVGTIPEIRKVVPTFDFALWNQNTVIEAIDLMITSGILDGPSVDMNEESHVLLESYVKRTKEMSGYIEELEDEIECYAPAPNGRQRSK